MAPPADRPDRGLSALDPEDLRRLRWGDVDLENGLLRPPAGGRHRPPRAPIRRPVGPGIDAHRRDLTSSREQSYHVVVLIIKEAR